MTVSIRIISSKIVQAESLRELASRLVIWL